MLYYLSFRVTWSVGSVGRAHRSHRWGHWFESSTDHHESFYLVKDKSFFCFEKKIEIKLIRYRKPLIKTALDITKAKRVVSRATGIPTTKAGRKRKALNAVTGGAYRKAQRVRAAVNCPIKRAKHPATCLGCSVWVLSASMGICVLCLILF